jgi:hypothetical protein
MEEALVRLARAVGVLVLIPTVLIGCSTKSGSANALPASVQPPDPCSLLTAATIESALHLRIGSTESSGPATSTVAQRSCAWSQKSTGSLTLIVHTQAAEDATVRSRPIAQNIRFTLQDMYATAAPTAPPVKGIGDAAKLVTLPNGDRVLYVLTGSTSFEFSTAELPGTPLDGLLGLAKIVVQETSKEIRQ